MEKGRGDDTANGRQWQLQRILKKYILGASEVYDIAWLVTVAGQTKAEKL